MSNAKHTPEPWKVVIGKRKDGDPDEVLVVTEDETRIICKVTPLNKRHDEDFANAYLIAAVPKMYAALRPFANYACDPPCGCNNCLARAAIAEAEKK